MIERSAKRLGKATELSLQATDDTERIIISLVTFLADIADEAKTKRIDEIITAPTKRRAIAQYLTALDYLTILKTRYPESNRMKEVDAMIERIAGKIEELSKPTPKKKNQIAAGVFVIFAFILIIAIINK